MCSIMLRTLPHHHHHHNNNNNNNNVFRMYAGEHDQALRVLTVCGKGRSGAVASAAPCCCCVGDVAACGACVNALAMNICSTCFAANV